MHSYLLIQFLLLLLRLLQLLLQHLHVPLHLSQRRLLV